jgi:hypothetical protein
MVDAARSEDLGMFGRLYAQYIAAIGDTILVSDANAVTLDKEVAAAVVEMAKADDQFGEHLFALIAAGSGTCSISDVLTDRLELAIALYNPVAGPVAPTLAEELRYAADLRQREALRFYPRIFSLPRQLLGFERYANENLTKLWAVRKVGCTEQTGNVAGISGKMYSEIETQAEQLLPWILDGGPRSDDILNQGSDDEDTKKLARALDKIEEQWLPRRSMFSGT